MGRDLLGMLERSAALEVGGDSGRAEGMTAALRIKAGRGSPPLDHPPCITLSHGILSQRSAGGCLDGSKQRALGIGANSRRVDVRIYGSFSLVVSRYVVALTALLVEPEPPALAL